jgi:hypothetical protein
MHFKLLRERPKVLLFGKILKLDIVKRPRICVTKKTLINHKEMELAFANLWNEVATIVLESGISPNSQLPV